MRIHLPRGNFPQNSFCFIDAMEIQYQHPSKYPYVRRDISVTVPNSATYSEIKQIVSDSCGDLLHSASLISLSNLPNGTRQYVIAILIQSGERTIGRDEANDISHATKSAILKHFFNDLPLGSKIVHL